MENAPTDIAPQQAPVTTTSGVDSSTPNLVSESTSHIKDMAEAYNKHGSDAIWNSVSIVVLLLVLSGGAWLIRQLLNKDRLHKNDALDYVKETHPDIIRPDPDSIDLLQHSYFSSISKILNTIKQRTIIGPDGEPSEILLAIHCDSIRAIMRQYRDQMSSVLKEAASYKDGFEVFFGSRERFETLFLGLLDHIDRSSEHELLFKYTMPEHIYRSFRKSMAPGLDIMRDSVREAARGSSNLERLTLLLHGFKGQLEMMNENLALILQTLGNDLAASGEYDVPRSKGTFTMEVATAGAAPQPPGTFNARDYLNKQSRC